MDNMLIAIITVCGFGLYLVVGSYAVETIERLMK
jgi:hypothetical protein